MGVTGAGAAAFSGCAPHAESARGAALVYPQKADTNKRIQELIDQYLIGNFAAKERVRSELEKIGDPPVGALAKALENDDLWLRGWAGTNLLKMKSPEGLRALKAALHSRNDLASYEAAQAIATLGDRGIPILVGALRDGNKDVRFAASTALRGIGTPALPALDEFISRGEGTGREDAMRAAGGIRAFNLTLTNPGMPRLMLILKHEGPEMRSAAVIIIGSKSDPAALQTIVSVLKDDPDPGVRFSAAMALGDLKDRQAVAPLCESLLHDGDDHVRFESAQSLMRIKDPAALPALQKAAGNDMDGNVRAMAEIAIERMTNP